jgi:hypothetical protein
MKNWTGSIADISIQDLEKFRDKLISDIENTYIREISKEYSFNFNELLKPFGIPEPKWESDYKYSSWKIYNDMNYKMSAVPSTSILLNYDIGSENKILPNKLLRIAALVIGIIAFTLVWN